ncbi:hypothetical protein MsAg5_01680 [Methanosarcinaceae archaeon Ag5]|uniref:VOC domain-containing protein n=1 Tax=Methanolapillus africanus TaxID=3028297 RepID=A0AAE4MIS3_9EURY|nr:hypothetical protein [Methanosarcinaceae archaeon Ag5]
MDLNHCTPVLFVKDAQKARSFYEGLLGMTVVADFGGLNLVFKEGFALWQIMDGNIIPEKLGRENIENSKSVSRFELGFETEEIDDIFKTLKENNTKFLHEMNMELWGQRTIRFYDPDGHLIEVGESMPFFLRRIYNEEGQNLEATSQRTFTPVDVLKQILGL